MFKITDLDKKWLGLLKEVKALIGKVEVGFFQEGEGDEWHGTSDMTITQIAAVHEFGAGNAPARPFVRPGVDTNRVKIDKLITLAAGRILDGEKPERELEVVGAAAAAMVQAYIADNDIPPPLQPETVNKKGSTKPLIDTGQMRQAISHRVPKK